MTPNFGVNKAANRALHLLDFINNNVCPPTGCDFKLKKYRTQMSYTARNLDQITHLWRNSKEWKLITKSGDKVVFPIAEVHITLCVKPHKCPAGKYKNPSGSCEQCAAGRYHL